jgi:hypothetical protein
MRILCTACKKRIHYEECSLSVCLFHSKTTGRISVKLQTEGLYYNVGGICNSYRGDGNYVHNLSQKIWRDETTWES